MWSIYQLNCNSATSCEPRPTEHQSLDPDVLKHNMASFVVMQHRTKYIYTSLEQCRFQHTNKHKQVVNEFWRMSTLPTKTAPSPGGSRLPVTRANQSQQLKWHRDQFTCFCMVHSYAKQINKQSVHVIGPKNVRRKCTKNIRTISLQYIFDAAI